MQQCAIKGGWMQTRHVGDGYAAEGGGVGRCGYGRGVTWGQRGADGYVTEGGQMRLQHGMKSATAMPLRGKSCGSGRGMAQGLQDEADAAKARG